MRIVAGSTAFLTALSLLATGLAVALALVWIIQQSRMKSARERVAESPVWDQVVGFWTESKTQSEGAFISQVQERISTLGQISVRFGRVLDGEEVASRLREALPDARQLEQRLRKELEKQGRVVGAISHFPIETLDGNQEALLVSYLREWKTLRDLEDRLSREISRLSFAL